MLTVVLWVLTVLVGATVLTAKVKRLERWANSHALLFTLIVLTLVFVPLLAGIASVAEEAHDAATDTQANTSALSQFVQSELAEEELEDEESCQLRNTFQAEARESDARLIDALEAVFLSGVTTEVERAEVQAAADQLRADTFAGRDPEDEDRDCDGSGELGPEDYVL